MCDLFLTFLKMLKCLLCFLSGICVTCRKMLKALADNEQISTIPPSGEIEVDLNVVEQMGNLTLDETATEEEEEEDDEVSFAQISSVYEPSFSEEKIELPREKLNEFLASRDISPIRHSLGTPWGDASDRTKRFYTRKARQAVNACLSEIAPEESEMLFTSLIKSNSEESGVRLLSDGMSD